MCCCNSSVQAFAWIGTILVNMGFIALITWGAATLWPLGFSISALYTCFLFGLAVWLERRRSVGASSQKKLEDSENDNGTNISVIDTPQQESRGAELSSSKNTHQIPLESESSSDGRTNGMHTHHILISLLYGLGALSMGVTGLFLPVNLVPFCTREYQRSESTWTTDVSTLPSGIQEWAQTKTSLVYPEEEVTFGYVPSTGITLFQGSNFTQTDLPVSLYISIPSEPPIQHQDLRHPSTFVQVTESTVCFQAMERTSSYPTIYCTDGQQFLPMIEPGSVEVDKNYMRRFKAWDGIMWFMVGDFYYVSPNDNVQGTMIYSLDPATMNAVLHSVKSKADYGQMDDDCLDTRNIKLAAIVALFATALPITALSVALWYRKQLPSMGITTYLGFSTIYIAIYVIITAGSRENAVDFGFFSDCNWWFTVSGFIWLLVSSHLLLTPSMEYAKEPLRWGKIFSSVAYLWGLGWVVMSTSNSDGSDDLWRWVVLNLLGFFPVILDGLATDTVFLSVLGALGLLVDAARLAVFVGNHVDGHGAIPLVFLVFAASGLLVGIIGVQLRAYKSSVQMKAKLFVKNVNGLLGLGENGNVNANNAPVDTEAPI